MRELFVIDLKDYQEGDHVFRRPSARGIILEGGRIALVYSRKERYYKFPGGGIHPGEDPIDALIREVREEVGLTVIPESVEEFGSAVRRQKSNVEPHTIFEQENFYYFCRTQEKTVAQELDDYEKEAEFVLRRVPIEEAIDVNRAYHSDNIIDDVMIQREARVLQLLKDIQ